MTTKVLGRWSPATPAPGTDRADITRSGIAIRNVVASIFAAQRRWLRDNWQMLASPSQAIDLVVTKQVDEAFIRQWDDFEEPMVRELQAPLGRAMDVGGRAALDTVNFTVDWSITNPEAQRYLREHGADMVRRVNAVTRERIRGVIQTGLATGQSRDQIRDSIQGAVRRMNARRATLIAQTEVIRAEAEGAMQVYREAGVQQKRWIDRRPNHCPRCAALHGQTVALDEPFVDDVGFEIQNPPRHPGCQCAVRAVVVVDEPAPRRPRAARAAPADLDDFDGLPNAEGLGYTPQMRTALRNYRYLDAAERQVMLKYLSDVRTKPYIAKNLTDMNRAAKANFPTASRMGREVSGVYFRSGVSTQGKHKAFVRADQGGQLDDLGELGSLDEAVTSTLMHETTHQWHHRALLEVAENARAAGDDALELATLRKHRRIDDLFAESVERRRPLGPGGVRINPQTGFYEMHNTATQAGFVTEYASVNSAEFMAVSTEYFLQRPQTLWNVNPDMFDFLNTQVFKGRYSAADITSLREARGAGLRSF